MALHRSAFIASLLLLAGCTQSEGDACQVNSDCEDGLSCLVTGLRGRCVSEIAEDSGIPDSGNQMVPADASVRDGSVEQDAAVDASVDGSMDGSVEDAAADSSVDAETDAAVDAALDDDAG
jgi:hypothetical protein